MKEIFYETLDTHTDQRFVLRERERERGREREREGQVNSQTGRLGTQATASKFQLEPRHSTGGTLRTRATGGNTI